MSPIRGREEGGEGERVGEVGGGLLLQLPHRLLHIALHSTALHRNVTSRGCRAGFSLLSLVRTRKVERTARPSWGQHILGPATDESVWGGIGVNN